MEANKATQYNGLTQARIKCQFVELYDEKGNKLFSLQRSAYGTGVIGTAPTLTRDANGRVKLLLSSDVKAILQAYITKIAKTGNGAKPGAQTLKNGVPSYCYVDPSKCNWEKVDNSVIPTVTPNGTTYPDQPGLSGKTKLALAAAAFLALWGN